MILFFKSSLEFTAKLRGRCRDFPYTTPPPRTCMASPITHTPHQVVHLLQLMNLYGHIITTQIPCFTLAFTLGDVHPVGLDKCIMMCMGCYIIWSSFTAVKILCAPPVFPPLPRKSFWKKSESLG